MYININQGHAMENGEIEGIYKDLYSDTTNASKSSEMKEHYHCLFSLVDLC